MTLGSDPSEATGTSVDPVPRLALNAARRLGFSDSRIEPVTRLPPDPPANSTVVLTNPDEDSSPAAFRALLEELLDGPPPQLDNLDAANVLRELRVDAHP